MPSPVPDDHVSAQKNLGSPLAPDLQLLKRRLGGYVSQGNQEAAESVRRELETAKLEIRIREIVEAAPPPTPELAEKLRALLSPLMDGGAADVA